MIKANHYQARSFFLRVVPCEKIIITNERSVISATSLISKSSWMDLDGWMDLDWNESMSIRVRRNKTIPLNLS